MVPLDPPTSTEFASPGHNSNPGLDDTRLSADLNHGLADEWTVIEQIQISGSPGAISAAVGTRGVLVIARMSGRDPVTFIRNIPYCGQRPLEPALALLLTTTRTLIEILRGPLGGRSAAHPVLIVSGAAVPFQHLDVLVTTAETLASAALTYPQTLSQHDIDIVLKALRSVNGETVPQRWPDRAPHERSVAEHEYIKTRRTPTPNPQPWRDWAPSVSDDPPSGKFNENTRRGRRTGVRSSHKPFRASRHHLSRSVWSKPAVRLIVVAVIILAGLGFVARLHGVHVCRADIVCVAHSLHPISHKSMLKTGGQ